MKVLYILSSPHGGSTLLSLVAGNHPLVANLGEVSFIPKHLALTGKCTCGDVLAECTEWKEVFDIILSSTGVDMRTSPYDLYLGDAIQTKGGSRTDSAYQTHWRKNLARVRSIIDRAALKIPPWGGIEWRTLPSIKKSVDNTMELYNAAAEAWDKEVIVDASKFPRKAIHLYQKYPDNVRILHLVRDGRGVTASRMKYMPAEGAAIRWRHYHHLTMDMLHKWVPAEHRMTMRYEDFVKSPESSMEGLCDWIGIPYQKEMLEFSNELVVHSAGGNPARFNISGGIKPADEKWRTLLDKEMLQKFDGIGGKLNRELGYE